MRFPVEIEKDIDTRQLRIINAIISKLGLQEEKHGMINAFTKGRTSSTACLTYKEAAMFIRNLNAMQNPPEADPGYKMRGKIMSMAHQIGWHVPGTAKLDFTRINNWCTNSSYLKKRLDKYTYEELPKLVSQFEIMMNDFLKKM